MSNCEKLREKHIKCVRLGRSLRNACTDGDLDMEEFLCKGFKNYPLYLYTEQKSLQLL